MFDTQIVFWKNFSKKLILKKSTDNKEKNPRGHRVKHELLRLDGLSLYTLSLL